MKWCKLPGAAEQFLWWVGTTGFGDKTEYEGLILHFQGSFGKYHRFVPRLHTVAFFRAPAIRTLTVLLRLLGKPGYAKISHTASVKNETETLEVRPYPMIILYGWSDH